MDVSYYNLFAPVSTEYTIVLVSDLHNAPYWKILKQICIIKPDYIAVSGDLLHASVNGHSIYEDIPNSAQHFKFADYAGSFLREAVNIAPLFFSSGNHELYLNQEDAEFLKETGAVYLDNGFCSMGELVFGGLSSPYGILAGTGMSRSKSESNRRWEIIFDNVNIDWLDEFEAQCGFRILLSHHPELYDTFLKEHEKIDLILSGHAHGGQIRIFGQGLYAHGQGFFPKYVSGIVDGRMIISRGMANTSVIPRIGNPIELVVVRLHPKVDSAREK